MRMGFGLELGLRNTVYVGTSTLRTAAAAATMKKKELPHLHHHQRMRNIVTAAANINNIECRKAVVLRKFGGPEVLEYQEDYAIPQDLKPNEILIRGRAASVNPIDLRIRSGYGRAFFTSRLPFILGRDLSGEVAAVGSSVTSFSVGQEVFGAAPPNPRGSMAGTYTDYAILSEDEIALKPVSLSHVEASAIPFASMTAWCAIKGVAEITKGQRVLVFGGGGAVGFAAIQLAAATGCHVTTTCGTGSVDRVLKAGAEQAVNYSTQDVESTLRGQKFDAVFDTMGGPNTESIGVSLVKRGGHYLTVLGQLLSQTDKYGLLLGLSTGAGILFKKKLQYKAIHGIGYSWVIMSSNKEGMEEVRRLTEEGKLRIPVDRTFPLAQTREAHEAKEKGIVRGKIVLEID